MIWDRWDDAMDDIRDERYELNREIEELESELRTLGVPVPPEPDRKPPGGAEEDAGRSFADRAHTEGQQDLLARRARLDKLRQLAAKHRRQ